MAHYFSPSPNVASRRRRVTLELDGRTHELVTDTGVFSADAVDTGTRALIDHAPLPPQGAVVLADIGCGYGPLTLALALRSPAATVWAVDANTRALDLCRTNAEAAGVADRVRFATPEEVPDDLGIDGFWSNPPIRVGKPALHALLEFWLARSRPGARAHLVVHKHLGSDSLARWIDGRGFAVVRLTSTEGYRILEVTVPSGGAA